MMSEIFGTAIMSGGGGSGATLTVTGVAGDSCTISKDGKSKSKTFGTDGKAIFKGLSSGTWTITMTNGTSTATRTIAITADYALSISYFTATINITYPAGSVCTCTNGTTTLTAPDTSGAWTCVVPNSGTWTVTSTDGESTASKAVTITADGQTETVTLSYRFYLFNNGTVEGITWDKVRKDQWNYGQYTVSNTIELSAGSYPGDIYFVYLGIAALDLSEFSTLKAHVTEDSGEAIARVCIGTAVVGSNTVSQTVPVGSSGETINVDVSALNDSYFISLYASGALNPVRSRKVIYDQVWLE